MTQSQTAETSGTFNYFPSAEALAAVPEDKREQLARASAVEPILKRWRHRPRAVDASDGARPRRGPA